MINRKPILALGSGLVAAGLALTTAAMTMPADGGGEPVRMSGLKVEGLPRYDVRDSHGVHIGQVIRVEVDHKGRTRYVRIALDEGGEARISAFRAVLDAGAQSIDLHLAGDLVAAQRIMVPEPGEQTLAELAPH